MIVNENVAHRIRQGQQQGPAQWPFQGVAEDLPHQADAPEDQGQAHDHGQIQPDGGFAGRIGQHRRKRQGNGIEHGATEPECLQGLPQTFASTAEAQYQRDEDQNEAKIHCQHQQSFTADAPHLQEEKTRQQIQGRRHGGPLTSAGQILRPLPEDENLPGNAEPASEYQHGTLHGLKALHATIIARSH